MAPWYPSLPFCGQPDGLNPRVPAWPSFLFLLRKEVSLQPRSTERQSPSGLPDGRALWLAVRGLLSLGRGGRREAGEGRGPPGEGCAKGRPWGPQPRRAREGRWRRWGRGFHTRPGERGSAWASASGTARGGALREGLCQASLCLPSRFGEHTPPCPLTAALFQHTLCLATDMPTWNSESKHSQMSHTFLEQRLENSKCVKDKHTVS